MKILSKFTNPAGVNYQTSVDQLKEIVNSSLSAPIPLAPIFAKYFSLVKGTPEFTKIIEFTDERVISPELIFFQMSIALDFDPGCDENSLILYLETLVRIPMQFFSKTFRANLKFARHTTDTIDQTNTMSDFLVWNSGCILVFRGEEKESFEFFEDAKKELIDKCGTMSEMFFGQIPYVFCYAAAGDYIQLFVINRQRELIQLSEKLDMCHVLNRIEIIIMVLNICWCLKDYSKAENSALYPFNIWIERLKIFFGSDYVMKKIQNTNDYQLADLLVVKKIYEQIKSNNISNTIKCEFINKHSFQVKLSPICLPFGVYEIDSNKKLLKALKSVVSALKDLHSYGFVHRDIRWHNILYHSATDSFLLTDFECAGEAGQSLPKILREFSSIDYPEKFKKEAIPYTTQVDLYLVGRLIKYIADEQVFKVNQDILNLIVSLKRSIPKLLQHEDEKLNAEIISNYLNKITL